MAGVENEIFQVLLQQSLEEQSAAIQKQNDLISHSEGEITRRNALIERKQTQIDQFNKKIEQKLSKTEVNGIVLSPCIKSRMHYDYQ